MHIAVIPSPFPSHVRALEALALALWQRGHRISWLQRADVATWLRSPAMAFCALGLQSHPPGSLDSLLARAARPASWSGLQSVIRDVAEGTDMLCREAPAALEHLQVDAIVADQMEAAGGLLAEALGLPFVSVACALPVNREPRIPLPVMPWGYAQDARGERLNEGSSRVYDSMMRPHAEVITRHAVRWGLGRRSRLDHCLSQRAQLSQTTEAFDFPRSMAPGCLWHVGPLRDNLPEAPVAGSLPPAQGRPLVFASLGTLQGWRYGLFNRIAQACKAEDLQLLVAHCNRLPLRQQQALLRHGASAVTGFAPQRAVLSAADVVVTHAGLNTVLDAQEAGTPQLALPLAFDQPGVAARIVHTGSGLRLWPALATVGALRRALRSLIDVPQFAQHSQKLGAQIARAGGASRGAQLIEQALGIQVADTATGARQGASQLAMQREHVHG